MILEAVIPTMIRLPEVAATGERPTSGDGDSDLHTDRSVAAERAWWAQGKGPWTAHLYDKALRFAGRHGVSARPPRIFAGMAQSAAPPACTRAMEVRPLLPAVPPTNKRALPVAGADAPMEDASQFKFQAKTAGTEITLRGSGTAGPESPSALSYLSAILRYLPCGQWERPGLHPPASFTGRGT